MRQELSKTRPGEMFSLIGRWMRDDERDHVLVARAAEYLSERAATPEFPQNVERLLYAYAKERATSRWEMFLHYG